MSLFRTFFLYCAHVPSFHILYNSFTIILVSVSSSCFTLAVYIRHFITLTSPPQNDSSHALHYSRKRCPAWKLLADSEMNGLHLVILYTVEITRAGRDTCLKNRLRHSPTLFGDTEKKSGFICKIPTKDAFLKRWLKRSKKQEKKSVFKGQIANKILYFLNVNLKRSKDRARVDLIQTWAMDILKNDN